MKIPLTVIDNFFQNPNEIRQYALELEYAKGKGNWPGKRTKFLEEINPKFSSSVAKKIFSVFVDLKNNPIEWEIESSFQLISSYYETGWVHNDICREGWEIAGVIYLNPDAPLDSGTSIHRINKKVDVYNIDPRPFFELKHKFYLEETIDIEKYRKGRDFYNSTFERTVDVGNMYNRLVVYNTDEFHQANKYFGTTDKDSRLTFVFFAKTVANKERNDKE
jgi:hypothetical protein